MPRAEYRGAVREQNAHAEMRHAVLSHASVWSDPARSVPNRLLNNKANKGTQALLAHKTT